MVLEVVEKKLVKEVDEIIVVRAREVFKNSDVVALIMMEGEMVMVKKVIGIVLVELMVIVVVRSFGGMGRSTVVEMGGVMVLEAE